MTIGRLIVRLSRLPDQCRHQRNNGLSIRNRVQRHLQRDFGPPVPGLLAQLRLKSRTMRICPIL
jgi:hypothetical protein